MATIAAVNGRLNGDQTITKTELTGTDDLVVNTRTQILVLENTGGSTPTINIVGDQATTQTCPGLGDPVDVSGGFDIPLAANETKFVNLGSISAYLPDSTNTPAVTGGTADVDAYIIEL